MVESTVSSKFHVAGVCRRTAEHLLSIGRVMQPDLNFDQTGVAWLESYITQSRPNLAADMVDEFVEIAGCFYGECLIETLGGSWARANDGSLAVVMQPHGYTFPFASVARQVAGDEETSIARSFNGALAYLGTVPASVSPTSSVKPELAA